MPRTHYCLPIDVTRRFVPQITQNDLNSELYLPNNNVDTIKSRIEGVESQFETDTGTALREVRVGSQATPATWERLEAKRRLRFPTRYTLDHSNVLPLDSSKGDKIEVRTARDNWKDITADEGSRWVLVDNRQGKLEFYSRLRHTIQFRVRPGVKFIRLTYRYGALGGSPTEGGQTTTQASISGSATPSGLSVADASKLPDGGGTMLLDGTEYVRVTNVDVGNNEVDIASRGLRRTDETTSHTSGVTLHYCPLSVREAIAAKAAKELQQFDNFVDDLLAGNEQVDPREKLDSWQAEYDRSVARHRKWHYS